MVTKWIDNTMLNYLHTPPFDALTNTERKQLTKHSQVVYLDNEQLLPEDWHGDFFVILKGKIKETLGDEILSGLNTGDWFDTRHKATFTPIEQTLLLRIDGEQLQQITKDNPTLNNLLFADLAERVAQTELQRAGRESQNLLQQPITELAEHIKKPNFIDETTSIFDAVLAMNQAQTKHILVRSGDKVGVFSQTDVCRAIIEQVDLQTPVLPYCNFKLACLTTQSDVSDALLTMLNHKVHRLPIVENGEIIGVLGQTELLSYLANHSNLISIRIEQAENIEQLSSAVQMIGKFIRNQHKNGTKTYVISRMVQSLNLQVFAKVWQFIVPQEVYENTCVIVMGSEGRGEQIMRTDQDNAIIIRDGYHHPQLMEFAHAFNDALNQLGYPYCDGQIMMNNPIWHLPLSKFKQQLNNWFISNDPNASMWLAVFMDGAVVCGDPALFEELLHHFFQTFKSISSNNNFISRFAKAMLQFGDGHRFWQKFTGVADSDIDLKKAGIFPIVHGTRTLCLDNGIIESSTKARLYALANHGVIEHSVAQNLIEALEFFLSRRLAVSLVTEDRSARRVNPNKLSALDKDLLKQSLSIVKSFKNSITHRYRLDAF